MSEPNRSHLTRASIQEAQFQHLTHLLTSLLPDNCFYYEKVKKAGLLDAQRNSFLPSSLTDFQARFPFTTKDELVQDHLAHPPFGTNLTFGLHTYTRYHQTSGTTGTPLRWLDTPDCWQALLEAWIEVYRAAEVKPADRVYFAFSFGPFLGFWMAFDAAVEMGCLCIPGGGLTSGARLRTMRDTGANVLCCTPTYALRLAEVAREESITTSIRTIIVAGEPGGSIPETRALLEKGWPQARVFDHHGMTEVGPVTHQTPGSPGLLQVIESGYLAEILCPTTQKPVPIGSPGELVLTTLRRLGSPLLRYRSGDLVKATFLPDNPFLQLEGGILGRIDDMILVRGVNVYPSAVEAILRRFPQIGEYQVTISQQKNMLEMELKVEPIHPLSLDDQKQLLAQLRNEFQNALSLRVPTTLVPPQSLPRFEMKAKRWIRLNE